MLRFECDYAEGTHKKILERLIATNNEQAPGYSDDEHSLRAKSLIKELCGVAEAEVHLLVGGTQTNLTVISSILRPHQGVLCAVSGHLNVHETGAIESTGHKVIVLPSLDGKITASQIQEAYDTHWADFNHEHVVQPGMVYISQPTENGTIYSLAELEEISKVCQACSLPFYIDGARLGYALAAPACDMTLKDIAKICDVFYIGGTKVGAMFGEAVVIPNVELQKDFRYFIKQKGALLAKGRYLGVQFEVLFEDGLYFEISKHAVDLAMEIRGACEALGYTCQYDSPTNQQFPILPNQLIEKLQKKYAFFLWEPIDEDHSSVRFCTSWATKKEDVAGLIADIQDNVIKQ